MLFERFVSMFDVLMRVAMRIRTWIAPTGVAKLPFGFQMFCDSRDFIQRRIYCFRAYEHNLTYYLRSRVRDSDCVADVGANVGYVTLLAGTCVGSAGRVISIEASPSTFEKLMANIELNGMENIRAINAAATGNPCMVNLVQGGMRNSGLTFIKEGTDGKTSVKGDKLSTLLGLDKNRVSFIKIDIEGSEGPVLQDILDSLPEMTNLRNIVVEMSKSSAHFVPLFIAEGFQVYGLPNDHGIAYYLVRRYLSSVQQGDFVLKRSLKQYDPAYSDYVFEREAPSNHS